MGDPAYGQPLSARPSSPPTLGNALDGASAAVAELHDTLDRLETRLGPLARPVDPSPNAPSVAAVSAASPYLNQLTSVSEQVVRAAGRVRFLLDRLEV
jgi:hypothetical protein